MTATRESVDLAAARLLAREIDTGLVEAERRVAELREQKARLMRHLRSEGCTFEQIATVFDVTRQRAWQKWQELVKA